MKAHELRKIVFYLRMAYGSWVYDGQLSPDKIAEISKQLEEIDKYIGNFLSIHDLSLNEANKDVYIILFEYVKLARNTEHKKFAGEDVYIKTVDPLIKELERVVEQYNRVAPAFRDVGTDARYPYGRNSAAKFSKLQRNIKFLSLMFLFGVVASAIGTVVLFAETGSVSVAVYIISLATTACLAGYAGILSLRASLYAKLLPDALQQQAISENSCDVPKKRPIVEPVSPQQPERSKSTGLYVNLGV